MTSAASADSSESVTVELASESDDAALRRLACDMPLRGRITISLEREPSFFDAASIEGDRHHVVILRAPGSGRIVAMGSRSVRKVYVNGSVARLGYLGQLRVAPQFCRSRRLLAKGYGFARTLRRHDELPYDLTSIMVDNTAATRLLTAGLSGLPSYVPFERFVTLVVAVRGRIAKRRARDVRIERGSVETAGEIAAYLQRNGRRFQFAPHWTAADLRSPVRTRGLALSNFYLALRGTHVAGCLAIWDQRAFKQTVVHAYATPLRWLRPFVNMTAPLLGVPRLPPPHQSMDFAFASHIALDDDDPRILTELLSAARRDLRVADMECVVLGFTAGNPLLAEMRRRLPHRAYESQLYLVNWGSDRDVLSALDKRVSHVEVALL
ncbi:MAG: hypothetical protein JSU86_02070 [Phycisphaerales bacterium]|nr:MAG: hypothetical protein JSU86_02070 [Phycisphaerales bacterium]